MMMMMMMYLWHGLVLMFHSTSTTALSIHFHHHFHAANFVSAPVGRGCRVRFKLEHQHIGQLWRGHVGQIGRRHGTTNWDNAVVWAKIKHVHGRTRRWLLPTVVDKQLAVSQNHPLPVPRSLTSSAWCTCHIQTRYNGTSTQFVYLFIIYIGFSLCHYPKNLRTFPGILNPFSRTLF